MPKLDFPSYFDSKKTDRKFEKECFERYEIRVLFILNKIEDENKKSG